MDSIIYLGTMEKENYEINEKEEYMMWDSFHKVAQKIAGKLAEGHSVRAKDISDIIIESGISIPFNCYPGSPSNRCHNIAFFVSLNSSKNAKGTGHLGFQNILSCLVQHMQGFCKDYTEVAVIITDSWDARKLDKWKHNIEQIKRHARVELFLFAKGKACQLPI